MDIINRLQQFVLQHDLFRPDDRVLLAVSGGRDSMLMARLFYELGQDCIIAHCNFNLRGIASDQDEQLVRRTAGAWGMPVYVKQFDTVSYAQQEKISIQMAARALRYQWFETLSRLEGCTRIAIAQHRNDHVETVLLNLTRGTGIRGMLGIQTRRERIIRPLLFLSAEEVTGAVEQLGVPFRDDQSNFSTKYARNKIRHDIIPQFREIQPDFDAIMLQNVKRFEESYSFIRRIVGEIRTRLFQKQDDGFIIAKEELRPHLQDGFLIYELFQPYGFNRTITDDLIRTFGKQSGAVFAGSHYELLWDRTHIFIRGLPGAPTLPCTLESANSEVSWGDRTLRLVDADRAEISDHRDPFSETVDADQLIFPLELRPWEQGDRFQPLGMTGKKKMSDFFIQQKVNRFEKERVPLLINGNGEVIWVVGMRLDNRYKVTENTKKVLTFVFK